MRWLSAVFALALLSSACGGGDDMPPVDGSTTTDGGLDVSLPDFVAAPELPGAMPTLPELPAASPELPDWGACPAGWSAAMAGVAAYCEPWAADARPSCTGTEGAFPGEGGCVAIDTCPSGDWSDALPAGRSVIYVRRGASGSGTRASPYGTIGAALAAAGASDVVAVAAGTYVERLDIPADVAVIGKCAAQTRIESPGSEERGVVATSGSGAALSHLTVAGTRALDLGTDLRLEAVRAEGELAGIVARGGIIDGQNVVVTASAGPCAGAVDGGTLDLSRADFVACSDGGVVSDGAGSLLRLTDSAVRELVATPMDGRAVIGQRGASIELTRVVLERAHLAGMTLSGGATATFDTVVLRDVESTPAGDLGGGVLLIGAAIDGQKLAIVDTRSRAVAAETGGNSIDLDDLIIHRVRPQAVPEREGTGIGMTQDGTVTLNRTFIGETHMAGIWTAFGPTVTATDLTIHDVEVDIWRGTMGMGIAINTGSTLTLERADIRRVRSGGILAFEEGALLTATDLTIEGVTPDTRGDYAVGIQIQQGSSTVLSRVRIEDAQEIGISAIEHGQMTLSDITIVDAERGMDVAWTDDASVSRVSVEGAGSGIVLYDFTGAAEDLTVRDGIAEGNHHALQIAGATDADVRRVRIDNTGGLALHVADGATARVEDLTIDALVGNGYAIGMSGGGQLELTRAAVTGFVAWGLIIEDPGSVLRATDLLVRETRASADPFDNGFGLAVQNGGRAELSRAAFIDVTDYALIAYGGEIVGSDVSAINVRRRRCADGACADAPGGVGLGAWVGSTVSLTNFVVDGADLCGVLVADDSQLDLMNGEVANTAIGACVLSDAYDFERLTRDVTYHDNDSNLDSTRLPTPMPTAVQDVTMPNGGASGL